jgi:hypothetical protein
MRNLSRLILLFLIPTSLFGQTLGTPTSEFQTKPGKVSHGSFQIQNNSNQPLMFTAEPFSVLVFMGRPIYRPLDSGVTVELSQMSSRLSPKEVRRLDYKASCAALPCMIGVKVTMSAGHTTDGLALHIVMSHFAYLAQSKHPREDVLTAAGLLQKK